MHIGWFKYLITRRIFLLKKITGGNRRRVLGAGHRFDCISMAGHRSDLEEPVRHARVRERCFQGFH